MGFGAKVFHMEEKEPGAAPERRLVAIVVNRGQLGATACDDRPRHLSVQHGTGAPVSSLEAGSPRFAGEYQNGHTPAPAAARKWPS